MLVLGLDASTTAVGWALLDTDQDLICGHGCHRPVGDSVLERIDDADTWLNSLLWIHPSAIIAVEVPVMHKNAATMRSLSYMAGVLLLRGWQRWGAVEILPGQRLTALGLPPRMRRDNAKSAVLRIVNALYGLRLTEADHDAADAVAIAVAAANKLKEER